MHYQSAQNRYRAAAPPSTLAKSHLRLILISVLFITLVPSLSQAQQATLTDDAYTSNRKANRNFGGDESLSVTAATERGFVKFKLTPSLPAGTTGSRVGKATLRLFVSDVASAGQISIYRVASAWTEQGVTDATAPALGAAESTFAVGTESAGKWVTVDLTQLVKDWLDGVLPNNGVALVAAAGADVTLDSKENRQTSHEPQLLIVLNHSATADQATTADTANTITGVLPANKGGTGLSASGVAGNVLRSNGAGWTSAPLVAADFPGLAGSFIQNQSATAQAASFNINGSGKANNFDAATQYNLGGSRVLFARTNDVYVGLHTGEANTTGFSNVFVGHSAGANNTSGRGNVFVGQVAGLSNTGGDDNVFFGGFAGQNNVTGSDNSFFGSSTGLQNTSGSFNTLLGAVSKVGANNLSFATAIGAFAVVNANDTIVLGKAAGNYGNPAVAHPADKVIVPGDLSVVGSLSLNIVNATTQYNLGGSRILSTAGFQNTFLGLNTGANNTSGCCNAFFGFQAGQLNNANDNSFFGNNAGPANTTGTRNSFFGSTAGLNNTTGSSNSFFGVSAGQSNTTGGTNSFFGAAAGQSNTVGQRNTFVGTGAGRSNNQGSQNSFFGTAAGLNNTTGNFNSIFGDSAGARNNADFNSFFGAAAGFENTSGVGNAFFGVSAGQSNNGSSNSFFGAFAGLNNTTGSRNTLAGYSSGRGCDFAPCAFPLTGSDNSFYGYFAGRANQAGQNNSFFGSGAGQANTSGSSNAFYGWKSGGSNVDGGFNSFFGSFTGNGNTSGTDNSAFGDAAGSANSTGSGNSIFGADAGRGCDLGPKVPCANPTTGSNNSFFGREAGRKNNTDGNSFFGATAGRNNITGTGNTFVGLATGLSNVGGSNNTLIGANANVGADGITNATAIGANASVTQSNTLVLGSINGVGGASADTNVGIGTTAPTSRLTVAGLIETTTGGVKFPDGTIQTTAAAGGSVTTDGTTLMGNGTAASPLAIKGLGVGTAQLADNSVTAAKIASGQVVKSLNGLTDNVTLAAGSNVTITPSGNTLTISATGGGGTGGGSFIQNQTTQQAGANFNIDGAGVANIFDAQTQYNLVGNRVLTARAGPFNNLFVGLGAGGQITDGGNNSFFGINAGSNTTGTFNSFFGFNAGNSTTFGGNNSFFGANAGTSNTSGVVNSFFGTFAGNSNTTGFQNSFFGYHAGFQNTTGSANSFFGNSAGNANTEGRQNTIVGGFAGSSNTTGSDNSFIGYEAGLSTTGNNNTFVGSLAGANNTTGSNNTAIGYNANATGDHATAIGADSGATGNNTVVIGRGLDTVTVPGKLQVNTLGTGGPFALCLNSNSEISSCSSSLRYKTNVAPFHWGLNVVNQLRPITFRWKADGTKDIGFGAEDVAQVNPLFVTYNRDGQVEGVKYDRLTTVLVNAVKEQQEQLSEQNNRIETQEKQIEEQRKQIEQQRESLQKQQAEIEGLKKLICPLNPTADVCKRERK